MKILGIDPGSRRTGYGIVENQGNRNIRISSGCIRLKESLTLPERLLLLFEKLEQLIQEFHPNCGVVEEIFFAKHVRSALVLGQVRGVILLQFSRFNLPIYEYAPLQVKQTLVGVGSASKEQMQHMVRILLNLQQLSLQEDEADALAIAITHAHLLSFLKKKKDHFSKI